MAESSGEHPQHEVNITIGEVLPPINSIFNDLRKNMNNTEDAVVSLNASEVGEDITPNLAELTAEQQAEAQEYAIEFIKKVIRLRGVKIERADYLRQEFRKLGLRDAGLDALTATSPLQAGVSLDKLDQLASDTIAFETKKSAAMSFAAGVPGGFAMLAAVPADITQYYVHAFRIMQKLAYIYGWQDFLGNLDEADDDTVGRLALFLGVLLGVGGASVSFTKFAQQVARPAIQKQIAGKALTKTTWYPVIKQTLKLVGIKVTKDSFAKTATKVVPVLGGVISGGMTLVSLKSQSARLQKHLRELPPPGVDASDYMELLKASSFDNKGEGFGTQTKAVAGHAASSVATGANTLLKGIAGSLCRGGASKTTADLSESPE